MISKSEGDLQKAFGDFIVALRSNKGYNEEQLQVVIQTLKTNAKKWKENGTISLTEVDILVDIVPATEAAAELYKDPVKQKIYDASYTLYDIVKDCIND